MLSDEIRMRIGQLHAAAPMAGVLPPIGPGPRLNVSAPSAAPPEAVELFARAEECQTRSGSHLRFRRPMAAIGAAAAGIANAVPAAPATLNVAPLHYELAAVARAFPAATLFLDLETCGFAGSPIFLAGLVWRCDATLVIDQLFARNYAEERAVLETLWQVADYNRVLVTFNGKSFDWPMVRDRSTRHRLGRLARVNQSAVAPQMLHCDLLHHARRRWKRVLPDCRLQTLERYVCRRARGDDLPGALVPAAYHEFVRSGNPERIGAILHHNALDLLTLVQLSLKLLAA